MKRIAFLILSVALLLMNNSCVKDVVDTTGTVYGIVNDADNGEPIAGASVIITPGGKSTNTGSDGHYEFQDMEPGQYTVQIMKSSYKTNTKLISVVAGEKAVGDILLSRGTSLLKLSIASLNFGANYSSLSFSIINSGTSGKINWSISNVPSWISLSETSGSVDQGKESAVVVNVKRDQITENKTANIVINGNGESLSLAIIVEVDKYDAAMALSESSFDFGMLETTKTFTISNTGTSGNLDWTIDAPKSAALTISPLSSSTAPGKSSSVSIVLDRSKMTAPIEETINVKSAGESKAIKIVAALADPAGAEVESCDSKISIKVVSCTRTSNVVELEFVVNNSGFGHDLTYWGILSDNFATKSQFVDDLSNVYNYSSSSNTPVYIYYGGKYMGTAPLLYNTPVKGTLTIKNFNASAKSVTCKIPCYASETILQYYFILKNVPIK